ncbi:MULTISPECIES: gephyrin-like molybdotransferase Glp [Pseudoxanthomonas]|uniref:Molybdopterin molybdenumtransferase n=1 Tax=Pseudoxanthomonas winnipegensis TaxID=2480810 RepID=A0AAW8G807_9GAMM|nr:MULTISPECIES: gephyrin-like molybdotransferase Glp [Pseudoxanthomonas]MDQ1118107.1 molybdopterin molybdotransferase [Pseudoxanthomonas winnipegensis]MDQ1135077.1 molybdopterin molybdotransferase [Pseudoxanthomonas winnipegensis]MDR6138692.1 molybdopterin molybdotransferase [Pseudoxanthomonas sp. SORGH_AS_0997]
MADPCAGEGLLSYEAALARLIASAGALPAEACATDQAAGRVLAEAVRAQAALPPFDNAAMDGYALRSDGRAIAAGSVWPIAGRVVAGEAPPQAPAAAWEIMTGAALPPGADSVVPYERTERLDTARMRVLEDLEPARHIRRAGSDLQPGDPIATAGTPVDATLRMLLAAAGIGQVQVRRAPRVAILSTGDELVADADAPLRPGQIRASNGPFLQTALAELGARVLACRTLGDDPAQFAAALAEVVVEADLVLTTGAVSAGVHDFVPAALGKAGAQLLFQGVAIRPGKPLLAARLAQGPLLLGLPGNPVATVLGFRFFAVPLLRHWLGRPPERPLLARLAEPVRGRGALRGFLKARVSHDEDGTLRVRVLAGQESFRIASLLQANAWATLAPDADALPAGARVEVYPRDPGGGWRFD